MKAVVEEIGKVIERSMLDKWVLKNLWHIPGVAFVPLVGETKRRVRYATYSEIASKVIITDTGLIDRFKLENCSDDPLFVRNGTVMVGKTQTRASVYDIVVPAGKTKSAAVKCVFASKGIVTGAVMSVAGDVVCCSGVVASVFDVSNSEMGRSQVPVWDSVKEWSKGRDDMEGLLKVAPVKVPIPEWPEKVIGYVVVDEGSGVSVVEFFDSGESFAGYAKSILETASKTAETRGGRPSTDMVSGFMKDFLVEIKRDMKGELVDSDGDFEVSRGHLMRYSVLSTSFGNVVLHVHARRKSAVVPRGDQQNNGP